jgi:N utilization substance protein B
MTRREIRESAFIILFERAFQKDDDIENIYSVAEEIELPFCDDVKKIVSGVLENEEELNSIISKYSNNRNFARIAILNKIIMQIAIYEINYDDRVPINVAINEAVYLAKSYTYQDDIAFINGILGSYSKDIEKEKKETTGDMG